MCKPTHTTISIRVTDQELAKLHKTVAAKILKEGKRTTLTEFLRTVVLKEV